MLIQDQLGAHILNRRQGNLRKANIGPQLIEPLLLGGSIGRLPRKLDLKWRAQIAESQCSLLLSRTLKFHERPSDLIVMVFGSLTLVFAVPRRICERSTTCLTRSDNGFTHALYLRLRIT